MRIAFPLALGVGAAALATSPVDTAVQTFTHLKARTAVFVDDERALALNADEGAMVEFSRTRTPRVLKLSGNLRFPRITPDGRVLALQLDFDGCRVVIWDLGKARAITALRGEFSKVFGCHDPFGTGFVFSAQLTRDGHFLLTQDTGGLRRWDARTGKLLRSRPGTFLTLAVSPDGRRVAALNKTRQLEVWSSTLDRRLNVTPPQPTTCMRGELFPSDAVWSPGSTKLAFSCDREVRVWNVAAGGLLSLKREGRPDAPGAPIFSPDGRFVVAGEDSAGVAVWRTSNGQRVAQLKLNVPGTQVTDVKITPGNLLLAAVNDGRVLRLALERPATVLSPLNVFPGKPTLWPSLALSRQGDRLAVASGDGRLSIHPLLDR